MKFKSLIILVCYLSLVLSQQFIAFAKESTVEKAPIEAENLSNVTLVNLNKADAKELATLPGIGESRALRIIDYREKHGKIVSLDELSQINGLGERSIAKLKGRIKF